MVLFVLVGWILTAVVLYWIVRLAVSHGMQDAMSSRAATRPPTPKVGEVIRRQQSWYDQS
jgi:hypothetical protein